MYIESVPNRSSPPAVLLRESYREAGRTRKRTLANLTRWPPELVEGLRRLLKGGSAVRKHLRAFATTAWSSDPHVLGGYSCALAGQAHLRPQLALPLGERLFFAGEACSLHAYGTAHGAAETGIAAAEAVAHRLARSAAR